MSSFCRAKPQTVYKQRKPEKTVLHKAIKKYYRTWGNNSTEQIPKYISDEFSKYLDCGILAKGFACAHCFDCENDFMIAFSCKKRGICPSCNTRAMVETAAHLIDNVIPAIPVRQFVISFPKRIRHYLQTHKILQAILRIVIDEIKKCVISCGPEENNLSIGAISFIHHFGNTLNVHPHFHIVVADGVFTKSDDGYLFEESLITLDDIADTQDNIQKRVLRYLGRRGFFSRDEIEQMLSYENSGFSLNANVRIESWDREGLERLIRYCARPPFKSENLRFNGPWIRYQLPKPSHTGKTYLQLEPVEFIDRISKFIPYPRRHRRHFHGVFAPNSPLRKKVTEDAISIEPQNLIPPPMKESAKKVKKASSNWSKLIARIYEVNPLVCECGKEMKIIAFVTHSAEIQRILQRLGLNQSIPVFDLPQNFDHLEVCQLVPETTDGFYEDFQLKPQFIESHADPPFQWEDNIDPPHWVD